MPEKIRVLIADDHPIVRKGLRTALENHVQIVGEATDGLTALETIQEMHPDIALLDMEMPRMGGIAIAHQVRQASSHTKIIFLTVHKDRDLFQSAIGAGASGYLLKDDPSEIILEGIRAVFAGRTYFSSVLTVGFAIEPTSSAKEYFQLLTSTERHILKMIASGKTSKEIGKALSLHYRTIENHRTNICRKLQLNGPNALIRFALDRARYF